MGRPIARIQLFGSRDRGTGWSAAYDRAFHGAGDGELVRGRTFTEALWIAAQALRNLGYRAGPVTVTSPDGRIAVCELAGMPAYGAIEWLPR